MRHEGQHQADFIKYPHLYAAEVALWYSSVLGAGILGMEAAKLIPSRLVRRNMLPGVFATSAAFLDRVIENSFSQLSITEKRAYEAEADVDALIPYADVIKFPKL